MAETELQHAAEPLPTEDGWGGTAYRLFHVDFTMDIPPIAGEPTDGDDKFVWTEPRSMQDAKFGEYGARSKTWNAAHALRTSAHGVDGRDFIRGIDPMMKRLEEDGDISLDSD